MEDLNRLHVFYASDEADGTGGFRDVLVTQADHPFLDMWWPPGHTIGWEHSFAHEWRDFLTAVIDDRALPPEQASFDDGYRRLSCVTRSWRRRPRVAAYRSTR